MEDLDIVPEPSEDKALNNVLPGDDANLSTLSGGADLRCGYGSFKPKFLQRYNNSKYLLIVVCWFAFVESFVVSGIVNVNTATLERRFDLSSSQVAWISSSYDLCGGVVGFVLGYLATFGNKLRMMAVSAGIMAVGSFVMVLPHLIVDPYTLGVKQLETCTAPGNSSDACTSSDQPSDLSRYVYVLIAGQVLHGFGGVGSYTIGTPVVDEITDTRNAPMYIGIMQGVSALGPAMGFVFGGLMLNYYVDFDRIDMSTVDVSPDDPRWVGAWWVGFAVSAVAGITVVLLLACFAEELPSTAKHRACRVSEAYQGKTEPKTNTQNFVISWRNFVTSLGIIIFNPTLVFMTLAVILEAGIVQAFITFLPKILQFQFSLSPAASALFAGALIVPGATIGYLLGGFIPKWLDLKLGGLIIQCAVGCGITLALSFAFLFRCDMQAIAGVTVSYSNSSRVELIDPCNVDCGCNTQSYEPVCGMDGVQYFSSCHAGCVSMYQPPGHDLMYHNCSCIPYSSQVVENISIMHQGAVEGICSQDCDAVKLFLPLIFLITVSTFIAHTAFTSVTMKVVPVEQRAFAGGIQGTMIRFLGAVPFPLLFGALFDQVCLVWQETCDEKGSCWIYDNQSLGMRLMYFIVAIKTVSTSSFMAAFFVYKSPRSQINNNTEQDKQFEISVECSINESEVLDEVKEANSCKKEADSLQAENNVSNDCQVISDSPPNTRSVYCENDHL